MLGKCGQHGAAHFGSSLDRVLRHESTRRHVAISSPVVKKLSSVKLSNVSWSMDGALVGGRRWVGFLVDWTGFSLNHLGNEYWVFLN